MPKASLWTEDEVKLLFKMRDEQRMKWRDIAIAFGRSLANVARKYDQVTHPVLHRYTVALNIVPPERESERRFRQSLSPRDLTAATFGDPLPGYSALERRA
jgi:hypothetical protein